MFKWLSKRNLKHEIKIFNKNLTHILIRDDDILSSSAKKELNNILADLDKLKKTQTTDISNLNKLHEKTLKIIPQKKWKIFREYTEILIVAITVAFGIRALFIQPFKIPTSSMQPTLFGIHYIQKKIIPDIPQPFNYLLCSTERLKLEVKQDGEFLGFYPPFTKWFIFPWTAFQIGDVKYELPGTIEQVIQYCFAQQGKPLYFKAGTVLCDGWLSLGDHLFVDRFTYHFSPPKRGDIVIFTTDGLKTDGTSEPLSKVGFYYVKRLIGMPGDTLKIVNNMLYVKTTNSTSFIQITDFNIPAINRIYSYKGGYHGHFPIGRLAIGKEVKVPVNNYFMLGDNTLWSADSRYWGFVPKRNIVGKASFVFWPFSRRWGLTDKVPALDVHTEILKNDFIPQMTLQ